MSKSWNKNKNKDTKTSNPIDTAFRIQIEKDVSEFVSSDLMVYEFPPTLTNVERAFVHNLAPRHNLKTKSHGQSKSLCNIKNHHIKHEYNRISDENRRLCLYKFTENEVFLNRSVKFDLDPASTEILKLLTSQSSESALNSKPLIKPVNKLNANRPFALSQNPSIPPVPQFELSTIEKRFQLPILSVRDPLLKKIEENRILLVQVRRYQI
jgi:hypothetical protein